MQDIEKDTIVKAAGGPCLCFRRCDLTP